MVKLKNGENDHFGETTTAERRRGDGSYKGANI